MYKAIFNTNIIKSFTLAVMVLLLSSLASAQVSEGTQPPYIAELIDTTALTQEQVDQMRSEDVDWGNIRIATLLAQQIAADTDNNLTFNQALDNVLEARTDGKDFGEIAAEYDLKLGNILGNSTTTASASEDGSMEKVAVQEQQQNQSQIQNKNQNKNIFRQLLGFLGLSKTQRPEETPKVEKLQKQQRVEKPEKPERLERPERMERPERVERVERHGRNF